MAIHFLDPRETDHIRQRINEDPEFKIAARFMNEDILLEAGDKKSIFKVREGVLSEIKLDPSPVDKWSYYIRGPEDGWHKLLQPYPPPFYQSFFSAAMRNDFQFGGNVEAMFAYYWATQRMIAILRLLQNEQEEAHG
jgi:hypothetical protein